MAALQQAWRVAEAAARLPLAVGATVAGIAELVAAARPLAAEDGPLRGPDGIGRRLQSLLAEGGALARLDDLADAGAILAPLAVPGGPLTRLGDLVDSLEALAVLTESMEALAVTTQSLPDLTDAAAALPELTELVRSVHIQVATIDGQLGLLSPSLDALGRVAGRLPGGRRRRDDIDIDSRNPQAT